MLGGRLGLAEERPWLDAEEIHVIVVESGGVEEEILAEDASVSRFIAQHVLGGEVAVACEAQESGKLGKEQSGELECRRGRESSRPSSSPPHRVCREVADQSARAVG
jgi:hypothetical protein